MERNGNGVPTSRPFMMIKECDHDEGLDRQ
jgi:hypothetical protein